MAKVVSGVALGISGSINELSVYRMRGVKEPVVRRKAGHTKSRIKNSPKLERFRLAGSEFGGRALAQKYIMKVLCKQKALADRNIAGPLNKLMIPVQEMDKAKPLGERSVRLTALPHVLKGFSLNNDVSFDDVVKHPIACVLDRETASATIHLPELIPGINFYTEEAHPWFGYVVSLGVVPDIEYKGKPYGFDIVHPDYFSQMPEHVFSEWYPVLQGSPASTLHIAYDPAVLPDAHFTLVLSIGIRYGQLYATDDIRQAPHAGHSKIIEVG